MNLTYRDFALHNLGEISVSQSRDYEGGDAPQRAKVSLRITLDLFETALTDGFVLINLLREELKTPHGQLVWWEEETDITLLDQPVTFVSEDLPDDPNAWGSYHQRINLVFMFYEHDITTLNQGMTFRRVASGSPPTLTMGFVMEWAESHTHERFDVLRPQRERSLGRVTAGGMFYADQSMDLAARRAALLALKTTWLTESNAAEADVVFGDFNQRIKVEDFACQVDEAVWAIKWSFSGSFVKWPPATYSSARFSAEQKDEFNGTQLLTLAGSIAAHNEGEARSKLATLKAAALVAYGYETAQPLNENSSAQKISANDGDTVTELSFSAEFRRWRADALNATYQSSAPSSPVITLGNILSFDEQYQARRFQDFHPERQRTAGRINLSGIWKAVPTDDIAVRRTALLAQYDAMREAVNSKNGTFTYAGMTRTLQVEEFTARINQAIYAIEWSLSAGYTRFPDEDDFATAEFSVALREDAESGDTVMVFSGRILSTNQAIATTKLDSLRGATLTAQSFTSGQKTHGETTVQSADADTDGQAFLELSFNEEYRKRTSDILSWTMRISDREDVRAGNNVRTYSGNVVASGGTAAVAYAAALAKAVSLGGGQSGFKLGSTIGYDQRQVRSDAAIEFVRLEFSYEYQTQLANKAYVEINRDIQSNKFETDTETLSGFVVAADFATAQSVYLARVKNVFVTTGRLLLSERTSQHQMQRQNEVLPANYDTLETRLEFNLALHTAKTAGNYAIRYAVQTNSNYLSLELRTVVNGSVFADTELNAKAQLDLFLASLTGLGSHFESQRTVDYDHVVSQSGTPFFLKLDFTETFSKTLTGVSSIIECEVKQELEYSGVRWVMQAIPRDSLGAGGYSIPQDCGITEGRRTISGYASCAVLETALVWCRGHRSMLTGDLDGNSCEERPRVSVGYTFPPLTSGNPASPRMHRVDFTFSELLPNYPMPETGLNPPPP
jgi:hypothetical protein